MESLQGLEVSNSEVSFSLSTSVGHVDQGLQRHSL